MRRAVRADLEAILKEAQALNDESAWCFTWNDGAARAYLGGYIAGAEAAGFELVASSEINAQ